MASVESSLTLTSQGVLVAPLWTPNHTTANGNYYKVDTLVNYEIDGVLLVHRCIADNDSAIPTDTAYWVNLGPGYIIPQEKPDWDAVSGDSQILNKPDLTGYITDAPDDGSQYVRKNQSWDKLTTFFPVDPTSINNVIGGFPLGSDWYNTVTGEKFYQKANGVWISYTGSTPPVDGNDSPVVFADLATTVQLPNTPIYDNGMGGLGATLTASTNGTLSVDGPIGSTTVGNTILVKDQPAFDFDTELDLRYQNGVYILSQQGSSILPYILTRVDYADETVELYPSQVNILNGAANKDRFFLQKTLDPTLGLDPIVYEINYVPPTQVVVLPLIHVDTATTAPLPDCIYVDEFATPIPGSPYVPVPIMSYLTATVNGPLGVINGVDMSILFGYKNTRILVKNQVDPIQNGDYQIVQAGSSVQPWKLKRITTTYNSFNKNTREWKINNEASTLYGNRYYMNYTGSFGVVGTTSITFSELTNSGGGGSQNLQDVTDIGNTTDNNIQFGAAAGIIFNNGSKVKEGITDAGLGGYKGVALVCSIDYELKWEAGRLYVMEQNGFTIREVSHNFTFTPTATDDVTKGFVVGSRWLLDDGTLYLCTDNTDDAAVWELQITGTQDLQSVTDIGATTTNTITVGDIAGDYSQVLNGAVGTENAVTGTYAYLDASGQLGLHNGNFESDLKNTNVTNAGVILEFPNKATGSYTIATTADIPSVDSTPTNGSSNAVSSDGVFDALALKADLVGGLVPSYQLPSYVDDVIEVANYAALPITGETGKIYVTLDTGLIYRWTGSVYVQIATGGSVTSVGLTMPSAFTVNNSPITTTGNIAVTGAGVASQYVRGDGTLANFPTSTGGGASVSYYLNGSVSQGTIGGAAYKEIDGTPVTGSGTDFTINADGYITQFITDSGNPNKLLIPGGNWNFETYFSASSSGGSPQFYIELYKYNGTTFTLICSNSATPENITGGTAIDLYFTALAVPSTALLATDRLAVRFYVIHSGRTITMHTENSHLSQIITTFSTGLNALNGLTSQVQYLATGTSGTDFAISSTTDTHTFNLPTASATNRGALSSANWSTFNGKQDLLVSSTNIKTINGSSVLGSGDLVLGVPLIRQEFTYSGSQSFTLSNTASYVYAVFVQGQQLKSTQYSYTGTTLTIINTLDTSDEVNVIYSGTIPGVLDYYTKAQVDAKTISTTSPLLGGGDLSANRTLSMQVASSSQSGYLDVTDWISFASKQETLISSANIKTINGNDILGSGNLTISGTTIIPYNAYLNTVSGNNTTAVLGDSTKPYLTMAALITALPATIDFAWTINITGATLGITMPTMPPRDLIFNADARYIYDFNFNTGTGYLISTATKFFTYTFLNGNINLKSDAVAGRSLGTANQLTSYLIIKGFVNIIDWSNEGVSSVGVIFLNSELIVNEIIKRTTGFSVFIGNPISLRIKKVTFIGFYNGILRSSSTYLSSLVTIDLVSCTATTSVELMAAVAPVNFNLELKYIDVIGSFTVSYPPTRLFLNDLVCGASVTTMNIDAVLLTGRVISTTPVIPQKINGRLLQNLECYITGSNNNWGSTLTIDNCRLTVNDFITKNAIASTKVVAFRGNNIIRQVSTTTPIIVALNSTVPFTLDVEGTLNIPTASSLIDQYGTINYITNAVPSYIGTASALQSLNFLT